MNDCIHFKENIKMGKGERTICELTNTILKSDCYLSCDLYNVDLSKEKICFNCVHFRGGGDWGLACSKHYHKLPEALDNMCEDGEMRGNEE